MATNSTSGASHDDWFWEGNVQTCLAEHLQHDGWSVLHTSDSARRAQGVDLLAERDGRRLVVEVKGYPSTVYERGPRQGQKKPTNPPNQARQWFSHALLSAMSYYGTTQDEVAMAFADFGTYRKLLDKTRDPLGRLGIGVYFVTETGTVERALDHQR